jgi:hypothetical protein
MSVKFSLLAVAAVLLASSGAAQITGSRVNPGTVPGERAAKQRPTRPQPPAEPRVEAEAEVAVEAEADAETGVEAQAEAQAAGPIVAATRSDFRAGAEVRDTEGGLVGTVDSTGNVRAKLPFGSFGKNDRGLVISLSRAELEAAAAAQSSS